MTIHLSEQQLGLTFDSAKEPEPEGGDGFHLFSIHNDRTVDLCLSTTTSLVLRTVSERDRSSASALYAVSPPSEMSLTTVASSVYMMMTVVGWVGVQLVAEYVALWDQVLSDSGGDLKVNSTCVQNTYCMYYIDQVCSQQVN